MLPLLLLEPPLEPSPPPPFPSPSLELLLDEDDDDEELEEVVDDDELSSFSLSFLSFLFDFDEEVLASDRRSWAASTLGSCDKLSTGT